MNDIICIEVYPNGVQTIHTIRMLREKQSIVFFRYVRARERTHTYTLPLKWTSGMRAFENKCVCDDDYSSFY